MGLTRRDALAALVATGTAVGGAGALTERAEAWFERETRDVAFDESLLPHLVAVAHVVYPSEVTATREFVRTYTLGRIADRRAYRRGLENALEDLADLSRQRRGAAPGELNPDELDTLLRDLGVANSHPIPDGTISERIRYYVVNELLYALYTSPPGGELLDHENPDGHPGGLEAYQQPPRSE